jgi:hypothetical protein
VTQPVFHGIDFTVRRIREHGSAGLIVFAVLLASRAALIFLIGVELDELLRRGARRSR